MRIMICGDSTAASYTPDRAPITGWGQILAEQMGTDCVCNHAMAGRSTKSFLAEGRLNRVEQNLQAGDLVLIQFTHNDANPLVERHTEPYTSFTDNLTIFVDTARQHGAVPVLLTPIPRSVWQNGQLVDMHGDYPDAIRRLAQLKNVPLIDVTVQGTQQLNALGEAIVTPMYMNFEAGLYPAYPDGSKDDTHTQRAGAEFYAAIVLDGLRKLHLISEEA